MNLLAEMAQRRSQGGKKMTFATAREKPNTKKDVTRNANPNLGNRVTYWTFETQKQQAQNTFPTNYLGT